MYPRLKRQTEGMIWLWQPLKESGRNAIRPPDGNVAGFNYYLEDFTVTEAVSGFIGLFAACAATVALGFQVKKDFDTDQSVGIKTLDIFSIIDVGLTAGLAIFALATEAMGMAFACVPVFGGILAVVGFVLMIVGLFVHPKPPETDGQKFLDDSGLGGSFMNTLMSPPEALLLYAIVPAKVTAGANTACLITATNNTSNDVVVKNIIFSWISGTSDEALFSTLGSTSIGIQSPGNLFTCGKPVANPQANTTRFAVLSTDNTLNQATLKAGDAITLTFQGVGGGKSGNTALLSVAENTAITVTTTGSDGKPVTTPSTADATSDISVPII